MANWLRIRGFEGAMAVALTALSLAACKKSDEPIPTYTSPTLGVAQEISGSAAPPAVPAASPAAGAK
jgi:hypothetical protein